jgi:SAM-dependent methyltransferase
MDPQIYEEMITQEGDHWWFVSRRAICNSLIQRLSLPAGCTILDAGCGSGGNLPMLARLGQLFAFEMNERSRECARKRGIGTIEAGTLPHDIPFAGQSFDLITMFDVLEHIEDDGATLRQLAARLKPGGRIFLTVPAYPWLFVRHDRLHHHFRRYTKSTLKQRLAEAGLQVDYINHWNFFFFPLALFARLTDRFGIPREQTLGTKTPPPALNGLMRCLVSSERHLLKHVPLPFGLSMIVVASRQSSALAK